MDGGPSSSSGVTSSINKFIVPCSDNDEVDAPYQMTLNVDPDCAQGGSEDDDDDIFEENGAAAPAPITRQMLDGAIERRSKERQNTGVKMSIGVYDDLEDDEDETETEEEKKRRFVEGLRNIRQKQREESFDFEVPEESESMRDLINREVNMMFNTDNRLDFVPMGKRKEPKTIEGYLWGGVIGVGSYGKVKEVIDMFTLTRRAAKIMKYDRLRKIPNGWDNIRSEMSILRRMNHTNVVKLIEVFNIPSKGKVYMIFEYCIGSVQQLLDLEPAHRLTVGEAHAIFIEMCHGLSYLHSKRVSHKDIKPGNLLVSIDFTVKICDFGVAEQISIFQKDGRCTKVNGTPKFQPPECVYGNHDFFDGYKADMWSAGVTLYNLVSGKYPFERPILLKLYECIGTEPLVMPTNVELSNELKDLLAKLLEKDFDRRLNCVETMSHPWFLTTFPEDQGLGRTMERMRTGDRPLTMLPSMTALYDPLPPILDENGDEVFGDPPPLVFGGELDHDTFRGFKFLDATPTASDGIIVDGAAEPTRRPSSRSMPTSAPPTDEATPTDTVTRRGKKKKSRSQQGGRKRSLFSCIFRSRTDSS